MPWTIQYTRRPAPGKYDLGWFSTELQNVQRAVPVSNTRKVTAAATQAASDDLVTCDTTTAGFTFTLLDPSKVTNMYTTIKNIGTGGHTLTIGGTVDGSASPTLADGHSMTIQSDGTSWWKTASV